MQSSSNAAGVCSLVTRRELFGRGRAGQALRHKLFKQLYHSGYEVGARLALSPFGLGGGGGGYATELRCSPDGKLLALGHRDGRFALYRSRGLEEVAAMSAGSAVVRVRWRSDGTAMLVVRANCPRVVWLPMDDHGPLPHASQEYVSAPGSSHGSTVVDAAPLSAASPLFWAACRDGQLRLWDRRFGLTPARSLSIRNGSLTALALDSHAHLLYAATDRGICLWDVRSTTPEPVSALDARALLASAFATDVRTLRSSALDVVNLAIEPRSSQGSLVFQMRNNGLARLDMVQARLTHLLSERNFWSSSSESAAAQLAAQTLATREDLGQFVRWPLAFSEWGLGGPAVCIAAGGYSPTLKIADFEGGDHGHTDTRPLGGNVAAVLLPSLVTALDTHPGLGTTFIALANDTLALFAPKELEP